MRRAAVLLALAGGLYAAHLSAEPPAQTISEAIAAPVAEGADAYRNKDYVKARDRFAAAQAIIDKHSSKPTFEDVRARLAVAYLLAKSTGEGKLGDPCPALARARRLLIQAAGFAAHDPSADKFAEEDPRNGTKTAMVDAATRDIGAAEIAFRCVKAPPAPKGTIPAKLAGHYYLSGVHEVGSELQLKRDGHYDYYMSYGAVDQYSEGTWQRVGDAVILTPDKVAKGAPLFKLGSLEPWDADAEAFVQAGRNEAAAKAVEAACPFLADADISNTEFAPPMVTAPAASPSSEGAPKVDYAAAYQSAKATEAKERRVYEQAVKAAMMAGKNNQDRQERAVEARLVWQSSRDDMQYARSRAGTTEPLPPPPVLPARCTLPEAKAASDIAEKDWVRGFAVIVGDPARDLVFSNVDIVFQFADGKTVNAKAQRRGVAWVEKRADNPVTAVSLTYRGNGRDNAPFEKFAIANGAEGVQHVIIDSRQLVAQPFDELRLKISGDELIGPGDRGRYSKGD